MLSNEQAGGGDAQLGPRDFADASWNLLRLLEAGVGAAGVPGPGNIPGVCGTPALVICT